MPPQKPILWTRCGGVSKQMSDKPPIQGSWTLLQELPSRLPDTGKTFSSRSTVTEFRLFVVCSKPQPTWKGSQRKDWSPNYWLSSQFLVNLVSDHIFGKQAESVTATSRPFLQLSSDEKCPVIKMLTKKQSGSTSSSLLKHSGIYFCVYLLYGRPFSYQRSLPWRSVASIVNH